MSWLHVLVVLGYLSALVKAGPRFATEEDIVNLGPAGEQIEVQVQSKNPEKEEKWLVDAIYYDQYQSDDPGQTAGYDLCPSVPDVVTEHACELDTCQSDSDCADAFRCCYNGCSFSCLVEQEPPAVIDWRKEPRRSRSGISWLVKGPEIQTGKGVPCSTTPVDEDEDPLLCPHGFFCHVDTPGVPEKDMPNSGYCVKETTDLYEPAEEENAALTSSRSCSLESYVLLDGARMRFKDRICRCKKGFLSCSKRKSKSDDTDVIVTSKRKTKKRRRGRKRKKDRGTATSQRQDPANRNE